MQVPSAMARICPEPMCVPAALSSSKPSFVSRFAALRMPPVGPPTCMPFSFPCTPPARSRTWPSVAPSATSYTPGFATAPVTDTSYVSAAAPLSTTCGSHAIVSALEMSVGRCPTPLMAGYGGRWRAIARRDSSTFISALSSPPMKPPGPIATATCSAPSPSRRFSRSSGACERAFPTPASPRPSRSDAAVLAGKGRLEHVVNLVLVQLVVRRRRRLGRPRAGDPGVAGVRPSTAWDRGALAIRRAAEVREQRRGGVEVGHGLTEFRRDELGRGRGQVAICLVRPIQDARERVVTGGRLADDALHLRRVEAALFLGGHGHDRRGHRTPVAVRRGLDHPDAVVRRARREHRP